ncbi:hypothetical protein NDU88_005913 [Pleurodeles waltl]|uniref:Uncharacterized protein n=1 Tax=Pleurodeles waltl TaxID=8319 RepID=A0AAV7TCY5_PLEWA|nr:hypothetical protein NDU88_005913 [Pleurodeles waltl]
MLTSGLRVYLPSGQLFPHHYGNAAGDRFPDGGQIFHNAPEPFLPKDGEATLRWEEWREYFVNYISTFEDEEELTPEKKKKILLHCLGAKGLKIYNSINKKIRAPEQGDVFSHALEDLTEYFRPAGEDVLRCSRTVLRAQCVYTGHEHR